MANQTGQVKVQKCTWVKKGSFRERHQKKENERFLKVYFLKNF